MQRKISYLCEILYDISIDNIMTNMVKILINEMGNKI